MPSAFLSALGDTRTHSTSKKMMGETIMEAWCERSQGGAPSPSATQIGLSPLIP
jgi:hypothetical protein